MTTVRWLDLEPSWFSAFTLRSQEAAFSFTVYILFWGTERVTHQTKRQLRTGKSIKDTTQNSLDTCFNHTTVEQWSSSFGDFFLSLTPDFTCTQNPTAAGHQIGRAVVTWCLSARLDSRRAASWHALCSTFMGTWSWENKRGDLCETRKEAGSKQTSTKRKRHQNASQKVGHPHAQH